MEARRALRRRGRPSPVRSLRSGARVSDGAGWAGPASQSEGSNMSIKLTDTQLALLSAASQRDDHCLTPPTGARSGPARKAAAKLLEEGLVKEVRARKDAPVWRRDEDADQAFALKLTAAGLKAIAIDAEGRRQRRKRIGRRAPDARAAASSGPMRRRAGIECPRCWFWSGTQRGGPFASRPSRWDQDRRRRRDAGTGGGGDDRRDRRRDGMAAAHRPRRADRTAQARIRTRLGSIRPDAGDGLSDRARTGGRSVRRGGATIAAGSERGRRDEP